MLFTHIAPFSFAIVIQSVGFTKKFIVIICMKSARFQVQVSKYGYIGSSLYCVLLNFNCLLFFSYRCSLAMYAARHFSSVAITTATLPVTRTLISTSAMYAGKCLPGETTTSDTSLLSIGKRRSVTECRLKTNLLRNVRRSRMLNLYRMSPISTK